jgi:hypothetical protein
LKEDVDDKIKKGKEAILNLSATISDCYTSKDQSLELATCLQKKDNIAKALNAIGIENQDILGASFFNFLSERDFLESFKRINKGLEKSAKVLGKSIDILDKNVSVSRNIVLGQYLDREIHNGLYSAEISIIDPVVLASAPKTIELSDSENTKEILDMTIKLDKFEPNYFEVKNYSNYPVEIQSKDADSFLVKPNDVESDFQGFRFYGLATTIKIRDTVFGPVVKYPLTVARLNTRLPEKEITFSCDATQLPVAWGLKIKPKCLESGTYADYENYGSHPLDVIFGNSTISLKRRPRGTFFIPDSGTLRSSGRTVTIKIRANLN